VPLHQAPRAVAQLLHVAADRGITHAKLNLRPVELGGIEIRLQTSAAGVTAQVIADSPEAAKLLQQAADDLRRSLERHDVALLSLDVSTAGEQRSSGSSGAAFDLSDQRAAHHGGRAGTAAGEPAEEQPPVVTTVELPGGLLVDVLA
jgi:flagellar hook-length control protein FliK